MSQSTTDQPTTNEQAADAVRSVAEEGSRRNRAYNAAERRLREAHKDEFNGYMVEEMGKQGIKWAPKPTAEEKAREQIEALLAEHPALRTVVT